MMWTGFFLLRGVFKGNALVQLVNTTMGILKGIFFHSVYVLWNGQFKSTVNWKYSYNIPICCRVSDSRESRSLLDRIVAQYG
jgi:hypothetical protein